VSIVRIVLFTRYPTPGMAKTRLIPALGAAGAADLHRRLAESTLAQVRASGLRFELRVTGASLEDFRAWLGPVAVVDQGDGDLGARLERAAPPYPVLFIGSDVPDIGADHLREAAALLDRGQIVVGPAADGGYWLLGLPHPVAGIFRDISWGTEGVLGETLDVLRGARIEPSLLPVLHDVDRPEDLARFPTLVG
jgi:uncharacterized protein